jgi:carbamoyltransferase
MDHDSRPWVLGIASSHNGSACLVHGDELVVAIQEERLNRYKRAMLFAGRESLAIEYCLEYAGIRPSDLASVVNVPLVDGSRRGGDDRAHDVYLNSQLRLAAHGVPASRISHHLGHAAGAFATSGFEDAAILVVDGAGSTGLELSPEELAVALYEGGAGDSFEHASLYHGAGTSIVPLEKHLSPLPPQTGTGQPPWRSLGQIFAFAASQIFGDFTEAGKVMGLAPLGTPQIPAHEFYEIVEGRFVFNERARARYAYEDRWPRRQTEYRALAASVQAALEEALLYLVRRLREKCASDNLCYAGGVALNSITNERIVRESGFKNVYVMPAAEDSGTSIGAAYYGAWQLTGRNTRRRLAVDAVGRRYRTDEIERAIEATPAVRVTASADVISETVALLCDGKIVGWFQGRSELGPRALGQRSILCDPRLPGMKDFLNGKVKHREGFRPFAPVVLLEEARNWFDLDAGVPVESPFMLRICEFRKDRADLVPAVVHVDGTGRLQTVTREENERLYQLVRAFFEKTGVPILLNTSFNVAGEPIVETPEDALWCLLSTGLDCCVLEDRIVVKDPPHTSILDLYPSVGEVSSACVDVFGDLAGRLSRHALARGAPLRGLRVPYPIPTTSEGFEVPDGVEGSFVKLRTSTRWGRLTHVVTLDVALLLERLDGRSTGWQLLEALSKEPDMALDAPSLVRLLCALRRASLVRLAGVPSGESAP